MSRFQNFRNKEIRILFKTIIVFVDPERCVETTLSKQSVGLGSVISVSLIEKHQEEPLVYSEHIVVLPHTKRVYNTNWKKGAKTTEFFFARRNITSFLETSKKFTDIETCLRLGIKEIIFETITPPLHTHMENWTGVKCVSKKKC